jgi:hypothetical protein
MKRRVILIVAFVALLAGGLFIYRAFLDRTTPAGQSPLVELTPAAFEDLRTAFNSALGRVRVIALLSPT